MRPGRSWKGVLRKRWDCKKGFFELSLAGSFVLPLTTDVAFDAFDEGADIV